jgi:hypothetical protein
MSPTRCPTWCVAESSPLPDPTTPAPRDFMEFGVESLTGGDAHPGAEPPGQLDAEQSWNAVGGDAAPESPGDEQLPEPRSPYGRTRCEAPDSIMNAKSAGSSSALASEQPAADEEALAKLNPRPQRLDGAAREGHGATWQTDLPSLEIDVSCV